MFIFFSLVGPLLLAPVRRGKVGKRQLGKWKKRKMRKKGIAGSKKGNEKRSGGDMRTAAMGEECA